MKIQIDINLDDIMEQVNAPMILKSSPHTVSWILYLPDEVPCICDTFIDAVEGMQEYLKEMGET